MQRSDPKMCSETSVADKIIRGCKLYLRPSASSVSFLCVHSLKGTGGSGVTSEQQWFLFLGTHWRTVWTGSLSTYSMRALTSCWHAHQVILWWLLQNKISCFSPFSGSTIIFIPSHFSGCLQHLQHITCSRVKVLSKYGRQVSADTLYRLRGENYRLLEMSVSTDAGDQEPISESCVIFFVS